MDWEEGDGLAGRLVNLPVPGSRCGLIMKGVAGGNLELGGKYGKNSRSASLGQPNEARSEDLHVRT